MEQKEIKVGQVYLYKARDRRFVFTAMEVTEKGVRPQPGTCVDMGEMILPDPKKILPLDKIFSLGPIANMEQESNEDLKFTDEELFAGEDPEIEDDEEPEPESVSKKGLLLTGENSVIAGTIKSIKEKDELAKAKAELKEEMERPQIVNEADAVNPGKELKRLMVLNKQGGDIRQYEFRLVLYAQLPPKMYHRVYEALQDLETFLNVNQLIEFKNANDPNSKAQNFVYEINEVPSHSVTSPDRVMIKNSNIEDLLKAFIANYNTRILKQTEVDNSEKGEEEKNPTIGFKYDIDEDNLGKHCIISFIAKCDKSIPSGELHVIAGGQEFKALQTPAIDNIYSGHKFIGIIGKEDSELKIFKNIDTENGESVEDYINLVIDKAEVENMTEEQFNSFLEAEKKRTESI